MNLNLGGFKIWIKQKIAITTRYEVYVLFTWEMMEEEERIVDSIFCWISGIIWLATMGNQYDPTQDSSYDFTWETVLCTA